MASQYRTNKLKNDSFPIIYYHKKHHNDNTFSLSKLTNLMLLIIHFHYPNLLGMGKQKIGYLISSCGQEVKSYC